MVFAKQPKRTLRTVIRELVDRTNTDTSRIRLLEQEMNVVKSKMDATEQALARQKKQVDKLISDMETRVEKTSERTASIESTLKELIKEIKKLASVSKIRELESLVEIYNPLKSQFVTKEEAERMIGKKMDELKKS